jgi:hypothetical protein
MIQEPHEVLIDDAARIRGEFGQLAGHGGHIRVSDRIQERRPECTETASERVPQTALIALCELALAVRSASPAGLASGGFGRGLGSGSPSQTAVDGPLQV